MVSHAFESVSETHQGPWDLLKRPEDDRVCNDRKVTARGSAQALDRLGRVEVLLAELDDAELAKVWGRCMHHLRRRDLIRTSNSPVGDYAERLVCAELGLERKGFSEKSIDAVGKDGTRYQIKARRLTPQNRSRQLSAIREIGTRSFDVLIAVFFNEDLEVLEMWSIPHEVVAEAPFVERTNSTRFVLNSTRRADPRITRLR